MAFVASLGENTETPVWTNQQRLEHKDEVDGVYTEHPTYKALLPYLEMAYESYFGCGGYLDGSRLMPFSVREQTKRYEVRKKMSWYAPYLRTIVDVFSNAIFSAGVTRTMAAPVDTLWASHHGTIDETMQHACNMSKLYGVCFLAVDRLANLGQMPNDKAVEENPALVRVVSPVNVPDWCISGDVLNWVKIIAPAPKRQGGWLEPQQPMRMLRVITTTEWYTFLETENKDGTIKWVFDNAGPNEFGYVPMFPLWPDSSRLDGDIYGSGQSFQIAKINDRLYNLHSEIDSQTRDCSFPILTAPTATGEAPAKSTVGSNMTLYYQSGLGSGPSFIAPSSEPIQICRELATDLIRHMFSVARLDGESQLRPSSISASERVYIGEQSERFIRALARRAQHAEKQVIGCLLDARGLERDMADNSAFYKAEYPDRFDSTALSDNMVNRVMRQAEMKHPSTHYNRKKALWVSDTLPNNFTDEDKRIIDDETMNHPTGLIEFPGGGSNNGQMIPTPMTQHSGADSEARGNDDSNTILDRE